MRIAATKTLILALALAAGLATPTLAQDPSEPVPGWGFVHGQCWQEPVAAPRHVCEVGLDDEPSLAVVVSSIVPLFDDALDPDAIFTAELKLRHGLKMTGHEIGPFATWQAAQRSLDASLIHHRRTEYAKVAFLAVSLEPDRLEQESDPGEAGLLPPPIPDLTVAWRSEPMTVWRTDRSCGLRSREGREIRPELVNNPFGEAGEGCPFQLAPGYGLYAFHVGRSGMICGEDGVCTEFYGPDGNLLLVADYSPRPVPVHRDLHGLGLIVTGDRIQRLWSFTERRYLTDPMPLRLGPDDRFTVRARSVQQNRLAVVFEVERAGRDQADYATFFLDTRRFEE